MNFLSLFIAVMAMFFTFSSQTFAKNSVVLGKLDNGLQYSLLHIPQTKGRVDVRLQVGVGASDENGSSEIGVAHMVEHMVFRSNPEFPQGVGDTLMAKGWRRGANFNALTNYERTLYLFSPNRGQSQLEETLRALSSMMTPHTFSASDWEKEKQVILAEWRQSLGVNERMNRKRNEVIRSGSRQARFAILGTEKSIRETPVAVLQDFHTHWYVANNMKLMISGDFDVAKVRSWIEQYFTHLPAGVLPDRTGNYYEPKLQQGWHVKQIQDRDSGASQVAIIFRLDDQLSRDYESVQSRRERVIERAAVHLLTQRLRHQQVGLPKSVSNVVLRKADIGRRTVAVGLFASVLPSSHQEGLYELLKLRAQILQYPITMQELKHWKANYQASINRAKSKTSLPESFDDAVRSVSENFFADKPIRTPAQNAELVEAVMAEINTADVNAKIQQWLNAEDRLVQMQAPSLKPIVLPSNQEVAQLAEQLLTQQQPALLGKASHGVGQFVARPSQGKIVAEQFDESLNITRWTLQNGDRVVVLKHPVANGKTYWQVINRSGFLQPDMNAWQAQVAGQIVWQSAPKGWRAEQLEAWRKLRQLNLSQNILPSKTKISGSVLDKYWADMLQLYHAYQTTPQIGENYRDSLLSMARQTAMNERSSRSIRQNAITRLRFGNAAFELPDETALSAVDEQQLLQQWHLLNRSAVTHFILTQQSPNQLKPAVERYLASIPRSQVADSLLYQSLDGRKEVRQNINSETRTDVFAWSFYELPQWQPEKAISVALLRDIAYEQLKNKLRDKQLGVYSIKFESSLNPDSNRVESELSFVSSPEKAEDLWRLAEQVLQEFPQTLTENHITILRTKWLKQEKNRLQSPDTWLNRLVLSETHLGDARYLHDMQELSEHITLDNLREAAQWLWNPNNTKVLIMDSEK